MSNIPNIRLYTTHPLTPHAQVSLTEDQVHYLLHVMRKQQGDQVLIFNGIDGEWIAEISLLKKKTAEVTLLEQHRPQQQEADIWLLFAPIKNVAQHFIAQKATELGVSALIPVLTDHTIVHKVNDDKLLANAIEAAEQCERLTVPEARSALRLDALLAEWPEGRQLIWCDETGGGKPIVSALSHCKKGQPYAVLIGPEGGFSPRELVNIKKHDYVIPVSLGPRILRADTAALAALACIQACCGDW